MIDFSEVAMLSLEIGADSWPLLTQSVTPPSVYLDQWALMDFAERACDRFTKALLRRNGTLLLSWFHLLEFSKVKSPETAEVVETFLEGLERHVAFLDPDAGRVVESEDTVWSGRSDNGHPALDGRWLDILAKSASPPAIFSFRGLLRIAQKDLDAQWTSYEAAMVRTSGLLQQKRDKYRQDVKYAQRIDAITSGVALPAPTRYVIHEVMNDLIRDARTVMGPTQWSDYGHTVVAMSYADIALLDKGWFHRAEEARKRLVAGNLGSGLARVYSPRTLNEFWSTFDV